MAFLTGQVDIFHVGNVQLRKLSAAGRTVELVAVENVDAPTVFAVMDVHHGEFLLFLAGSFAVTVFLCPQFCHILPLPAIKSVRQKKRAEAIA